MNSSLFIHFYRYLVYPLLWAGLKLFSYIDPKIALGFQLRRKQNNIWPWIANLPEQKPIWFHCSSLEFEYARIVIHKIKAANPKEKILVTFFSPSVQKQLAENKDIDFHCPLPWDTKKHVSEFLRHHQPKALLIARTDVWPEILFQCNNLQIPSLLFSATLTEKGGRTNPLVKPFYKWVMSQLSQIYCVCDLDLKQFQKLGLEQNCEIGGDTRYEQVLERLKNPNVLKPALHNKSPDAPITLVAGSTWSQDEGALIKAFGVLRKDFSPPAMILVPHEPTSEHLSTIEALLKALQIPFQFYSFVKNYPKAGEILIIDKVGILAELYTLGELAFVGGSFKKEVHSVMEALAAGCVTFVGPHYKNNREAQEFMSIELPLKQSVGHIEPGFNPLPFGFSVVTKTKNARDLAYQLSQILDNERSDFEKSAVLIKEEVKNRANATEKVLHWIQSNHRS